MSYGAANPSPFDVDVELGAAGSHQHATTHQPRSLRPFAVRKRIEANDSASSGGLRLSSRSAILTVGLVAVACVAGVAGVKSGIWAGASSTEESEEMLENSHKHSSSQKEDTKVTADEIYGGENPFWGGVGTMDTMDAAENNEKEEKEDTKVTADEIYGSENPFYGVGKSKGKAAAALDEVSEEEAGGDGGYSGFEPPSIPDEGTNPDITKVGNGNTNVNGNDNADGEAADFSTEATTEASTMEAQASASALTDKKQAWLDRKKAAAFDEVSEDQAGGDGGYSGFEPPSIPDEGTNPDITKVGNGNTNVNGNGKRA